MNKRTSTSQFQYIREDGSNSFLSFAHLYFLLLFENNLFNLPILQFTLNTLYFLLRGELASLK